MGQMRCLAFGILAPPMPGHMNPLKILAAELVRRGHKVVFLAIPDIVEGIEAAGLEAVAYGGDVCGRGFVASLVAGIARRPGVKGTIFWHEQRAVISNAACAQLPVVIRDAKIDVLLVDQVEPAGRAIAEHLDMPYVTISNALPLNRDPRLPPAFTSYGPPRGALAACRNKLLTQIGDRIIAKTNADLHRWRAKWGLPRLSNSDILFANSPYLQIVQMPRALDFDRAIAAPHLHYVGALRSDKPVYDVPFSETQLDGRPLVYASIGTLQTERGDIFHKIAAAFADGPFQLLIAHGGALSPEQVRALPGDPLVHTFVPQEKILRQAALCVSHGGLNTVVDAIQACVPVLVLPIAFEQPAIAARVAHHRCGDFLFGRAVTPTRIREAAERLVDDAAIRVSLERMSAAIMSGGGARRAGDLILQMSSIALKQR